MSDQRGGIVTGWLFKLVLSLALVGLLAFEAGAVIVARVSAESVASDAAREAAFVYARDPDVDEARGAANDYIVAHGAILAGFSVSPDGRSVFVTVEKKAKTLFLHRIGVTDSWAVARTTRRRGVT